MMCSEGMVSSSLREITAHLQRLTGEGPYGVLGGDLGYGVDFENDVFMMHPFCWCGRSDCAWCLECECPDEAEMYFVGDERVSFAEYCDEYNRTGNDNRSFAVDKNLQCVPCQKRDTVGFAPNFLFKPTGATVRWYKYIGRGMEVDGVLPMDFAFQCVSSAVAAEKV